MCVCIYIYTCVIFVPKYSLCHWQSDDQLTAVHDMRTYLGYIGYSACHSSLAFCGCRLSDVVDVWSTALVAYLLWKTIK